MRNILLLAYINLTIGFKYCTIHQRTFQLHEHRYNINPHSIDEEQTRNFRSWKAFISIACAYLPIKAVRANDLQILEKESGDQDLSVAASFVKNLEEVRPLNSDELEVIFSNESLGLSLSEKIYEGYPIVTIKEFIDKELELTNPNLRRGAIITKVGSDSVDGISLRQISKLIKVAPRPLVIRFRDPSRFFELLDSTKGPPLRIITSSYLPANARDAGASEQLITVQRLEMPPPSERIRSSQLLDVMEIQYVAQVQGKDGIVDSSAEKAPPGTSTQSIYYILGQRNGPPGTFPPGWDYTLRGMVVGEKRRITLPYTLAFERKGVKDRGIPPFATMIYTVKLLSLT